jgi:hypothetical protein
MRTGAAPIRPAPAFVDGCKPDFVLLHRFGRRGVAVIYLALAVWMPGQPFWSCDYYPEVGLACESGQATLPPVLSCTAQGLSCPLTYAWGGGLLPRLFTLASSIPPLEQLLAGEWDNEAVYFL